MSLNPQQQAAVTCTEGPLLILAGAGSGKTTVLVHRIAHLISLGVPPASILAVTFTNKAAAELKERVAAAGAPAAREAWVSTFHSLCVRILQRHIAHIPHLSSSFSIYDTSSARTLLRRLMREEGLLAKKGESVPGLFSPDTLLSRISSLKNELIDPASFVAGRPLHPFIDWPKAEALFADMTPYLDALRVLYPRYQQALAQSNAADFDDLIGLTVDLFARVPDVLSFYQQRFRYIMIDEYQDGNRAQYILSLLLAAFHRNIAAVGDDWQAIYGFRGSDIRNILRFDDDYPEARVIKLEQNYRSSRTIVELANQVIARNSAQKTKRLFTERGWEKKAERFEAASPFQEADFVARSIDRLSRRGTPLSDIAVLYRSNYQSGLIESALYARGIAHRVVGDIQFWNRAEIADVMAYLQFVCNPDSTADFERIINQPRRGIGPASLTKILSRKADTSLLSFLHEPHALGLSQKARANLAAFAALVRDWQQKKTTLPASQMIQEVIESSGYRRAFAHEDRVMQKNREDHLQQLIAMASAFEQQTDSNALLPDFLENAVLSRSVSESSDAAPEAVPLLTIHAAKGLEFAHVFLIGLNEGVFPAPYAEGDAGEEEERRVFYVALTRAKDQLHLSYAKQKLTSKYDAAGRAIFAPAQPSRFLREFDPSFCEAPVW